MKHCATDLRVAPKPSADFKEDGCQGCIIRRVLQEAGHRLEAPPKEVGVPPPLQEAPQQKYGAKKNL